MVRCSGTEPLPTQATGMFTTVHDNETTVCILVWGGEDSQASKNTLLALKYHCVSRSLPHGHHSAHG